MTLNAMTASKKQIGNYQNGDRHEVGGSGTEGGPQRMFLPVASDLVERYSEAAIERAAATPVMLPVSATSRGSFSASVNPASAP